MPGGPSNRMALRGEPPICSAKVRWARNRLSVLVTSSTRPSEPTHVVEGHLELVGPVEDVGRAAGAQQRHHHHQQQDGDQDHGRQHGDRGRRGSGGSESSPSGRRRPAGSAGRRSGPAPWTAVAAGWNGRVVGGHRRRWWPSGPRCCCPVPRAIPIGPPPSGGASRHPTRVGTNSRPDGSDTSYCTMACLQLANPGPPARRREIFVPARTHSGFRPSAPLSTLTTARPACNGHQEVVIADDRPLDPRRAPIAAQGVHLLSRSDGRTASDAERQCPLRGSVRMSVCMDRASDRWGVRYRSEYWPG